FLHTPSILPISGRAKSRCSFIFHLPFDGCHLPLEEIGSCNDKWQPSNGKWKMKHKNDHTDILCLDLPRKSVCFHYALRLREMAAFVSDDEPKRVEQAVNHHAHERRRDDDLRRIIFLQRPHHRQQLALMDDETINNLQINRA